MLKKITSRLKRFFIQLPKLSYELSSGKFTSGLILYLKLSFFVASRQSLFKGKEMIFHFIYREKPFCVKIYDNLDITVLIELFVLKEYVWRLNKPPKTILDLGAHWGDTALFYSLEYPDAQIISVEPMPDAFKRLKEVISPFPNVTAINVALSSTNGKQTMYEAESSLGSSLKERVENAKQVTTQGLTMSEILSRTGVGKFDLIKFDIEGAEEILFSEPNFTSLGDAFIGEIHLDLISMSLEQVMRVFDSFEISVSKISSNRYILKAVKTN